MSETETTVDLDPRQKVVEWRARLAAGEQIPDDELIAALALIRRSRLVPVGKPKSSKTSKPAATQARTAEQLASLFTQRI